MYVVVSGCYLRMTWNCPGLFTASLDMGCDRAAVVIAG